MDPRKIRITFWGYVLFFVLFFFLFNLSVPAEPAEVVLNHVTVENEPIKVIVGSSVVVRTPWPAVRVAVTDPKIANVQVLTPNQVLLQGLKVGSSDFIIWSQDEKEIKQWKVQVTLDPAYFHQKLRELFPGSTLEVAHSADTLVVRGMLRSAEQAAGLKDYLEKTEMKYVNMASLAGVQQVQLQVRVAEVSRSVLRSLGINFLTAEDDFFGMGRVGSASGGALVPTLQAGPGAIGGGLGEGGAALDSLNFVIPTNVVASPAISLIAGFPKSNLEFFIQALAENQYLRILANPTLVAMSGEEATFLAGGEYPIPVVQGTVGGTGGSNSITIEYKEYGVRLTFRPMVLGDGTIRLYAAPEVSDLTQIGAVEIEGFRVPALLTRKAETTLELKSGQSFAMAGLINNKVQAINSHIPGLGALPVLGPLFRSVRYQEDETELVVLVTASLVEPMYIAQDSPVPGILHSRPDDWEFYVEGRIQGERAAVINPADAEWLKQMGLDCLVGPGAWDSYKEPPAQETKTQ